MEIVDADGRRYRRRTAPKMSKDNAPAATMQDAQISDDDDIRAMSRECPVPKPTGMVGRMLGFKDEEKRSALPVQIEHNTRIPQKTDGRGAG